MSEPQLIVQDFQGVHNKNGDVTRNRLIKGATWKRQRVVVIIPADSVIPAKCALALWGVVFPPNQGVVRILAQGCEVGDAYSKAIEGVLAHPELKNWEFLLTVEQDNAPPPDGLLRLIEAMEKHPEYAAISGSYWTKGPGGVWQGWGDPKDALLNFRPQIPVPGTIQEVCGLGMGFCLFRLSVFKDPRLPRPLFQTKKGSGGCATQDLSFWQEARKFGHRCAVDVDCHVGHYDLTGQAGPPDTMW